MIQKAKFNFVKGMNQDVSKSLHPGDFYYEGSAIRIVNTDSQSSYSVTNEKGNKFELTMPMPVIDSSNNRIEYDGKYLPFENTPDNEILHSALPSSSGVQTIIGHVTTRDSIVLMTTDNNGFDCIWNIEGVLKNTFNIILLYCRNLFFNTSNPIQALFNYENEIIRKIYWVDGVNQLRFLNLNHSIDNGDYENLIDLNASSINVVGDYKMSQPSLFKINSGGSHTAGMIQYTYNLYKIGGSQTSLSTFSKLISLDKGDKFGGGNINESVGSSPTLNIKGLDSKYTHIKVYSVKYTSYNETPTVNLLIDERIDNYETYTFSDYGSKISTLTLAEFLFLGSNPVIPKHLQSKDNRLFAGNYVETAYKLDVDMRAYSHDDGGAVKLLTGGSVKYENGQTIGQEHIFSSNDDINIYGTYLKSDDAINPDYTKYKYQKNGYILGGEGKFIKYELIQLKEKDLVGDLKYLRFFKDDEIYRLGIQFYNKLGQVTEVKWIADFKSPIGNLQDQYNTLKVEVRLNELKQQLLINGTLSDNMPTHYKIVRAVREESDKTILCQGMMQGMMVQTTSNSSDWDYWFGNDTQRIEYSPIEVKLPIILSRGFKNLPNETYIRDIRNLNSMNHPYSGWSENDGEIYVDGNRNYKRQHSWQYTKMMQMYSPDIMFREGLTFDKGVTFRPKGIAAHKTTNMWHQKISTANKNKWYNDKHYDIQSINGSPSWSYSLIGPVEWGNQGNAEHKTYNRQYTKSFTNFPDSVDYNIYGSPEITERGAGVTSYNNDGKFKYNNSLESIISDKQEGGDYPAIKGVNSHGAKCATLVIGNDDDDEIEKNAKTLESLLPDYITGDIKMGVIIGEIRRPESYIYNGNIYGGNTVYGKQRSSYIEISPLMTANEPLIHIESPGDTYVQNYKYGRILKTDTEWLNYWTYQITEIVEVIVETSVNLYNRSDKSLLVWDDDAHPRYDNYHNYNNVYSQSSNLIKRNTDDLDIKDVDSFDTRIISSKLKTPGEKIDSWTDFLENETLDLDGKYGSLNSLVNSNDVIYAIQDSAVAKLAINPMVQTQASDGLSIELGRGAVLYNYVYLTTKSGTLNKWSVQSSPYGFYYLDLINKSLMRFRSNISNLSDEHGLHAYFQNNLNFNMLVEDNPLIKLGVSSGYDVVNGDSYTTFLQGDKSFTIRYNEKTQSFNSFEPYTPSRYIEKGTSFITVDPTDTMLYSQMKGKYNEFYGEHHPSSITLMVNPAADIDCTFNNLEYRSEMYIDGIDQPTKTLTHITAWNEYQETGRVKLVLGRNKNLRRKFRKWTANIPRNKGSRDRIRNQWMFLKLELDNKDDSKFILHDIIIHYTPGQ